MITVYTNQKSAESLWLWPIFSDMKCIEWSVFIADITKVCWIFNFTDQYFFRYILCSLAPYLLYSIRGRRDAIVLFSMIYCTRPTLVDSYWTRPKYLTNIVIFFFDDMLQCYLSSFVFNLLSLYLCPPHTYLILR